MAAPKSTGEIGTKGVEQTSESHLTLIQETNPFWQSNLFSDVYLRIDVPNKYRDVWENDHTGSFYEFCEQFRNLCEELRGENFDAWSERTTINRFIKPVLKLLGWANKCSSNQEPWTEDESLTIKEDGETKVFKPDFIIVDDPKQLKYIEGKDGEAKIQEARTSSVISIEAKYWGRIDESKYSKKEDKHRADKKPQGDAAKSLDFDDQCLKYVDILHHDYGILTDGRTWRLYHRELSSGSIKRCYQFNLGKLAKHVLAGLDRESADYSLFVENAKYFYHLFSKAALYNDDGGRRFVDDLIADSRKYSDKIEEDLKLRFLSAMTKACNGFRISMGKSFSEKKLDLIRSTAESHIFNILFLRYCESKNILPIRQNPDYRKASLSNAIDKLDFFNPEKESDDLNSPTLRRRFKEQFDYKSNGTELYDLLLNLVKILQSGLKHPAAKFSISGFRETVFSAEEIEFSKAYKLTNRDMVSLLFELAYTESEKPGQYQQIPYSFFAPRQLGSIYESFLEFRLEKAEADMAFIKNQWKAADIESTKVTGLKVPIVEKGSLFFSPNNDQRKATGSYYTPDLIVRHVVQRSLVRLTESRSAKQILGLRVCDPAMGSGHFLAGALEFLAKKYLEKADEELAGDLDIDILDAKQKVLHHCIHGVDINPRAVKLAKMSLWLESAAPNKPLEPLDDQLRCADSLLDQEVWVNSWDVKRKPFDAVIGNPPYLSCKRISATAAEKYKQRFKAASGQYDVFCLFVELARNISANGIYSFVLPDTILFLPAYSATRDIYYNEMSELFLWGDGHFDDATVAVCTPVCTSGRVSESFLSSSFGQSGQIIVERADFPTEFYPKMTSSLIKFERRSRREFIPFSAICTIKRGEEISKANLKEAREVKTSPCIVANEISDGATDAKVRYYIDNSKIKKVDLHSGSRIVSQRIRNPSLPRRIIASFIDSTKVAIANVAVTKPTDPNDTHFLLAVLNSQLMNYYFFRKYIDVNVNEAKLNCIPLPKNWKESGAYKKIRTLAATETGSIFRNEKINDAIEKLYEIDESLRAEIRLYAQGVPNTEAEQDLDLEDAS